MLGVAEHEVLRPLQQFGVSGCTSWLVSAMTPYSVQIDGIDGEHGQRRPLAPRRIGGASTSRSVGSNRVEEEHGWFQFPRMDRHGRGGTMKIV